jgi:hypothetical protein
MDVSQSQPQTWMNSCLLNPNAIRKCVVHGVVLSEKFKSSRNLSTAGIGGAKAPENKGAQRDREGCSF